MYKGVDTMMMRCVSAESSGGCSNVPGEQCRDHRVIWDLYAGIQAGEECDAPPAIGPSNQAPCRRVATRRLDEADTRVEASLQSAPDAMARVGSFARCSFDRGSGCG